MEVEFFATHEEAMARLEEARKAADARVKPWQAALKPGERFIYLTEGLVIFGEVLETHEEPHLKHYRFCRCFSVACPEGELGDVHVSTVACRISRQFFEEMRKAGWAMEGPAPPLADGAAPPLERGRGPSAGGKAADHGVWMGCRPPHRRTPPASQRSLPVSLGWPM